MELEVTVRNPPPDFSDGPKSHNIQTMYTRTVIDVVTLQNTTYALNVMEIEKSRYITI